MRRRRRIVEAEEFVMKDDAGNPRVTMTMGAHGPVFCMLDHDGDVRLSLSASDHGPYVEFCEPGTESIIQFGMSGTNLHLSCTYRHDGIHAEVNVEVNGDGIGFYDEEGRLLCSIPGRSFEPPV